MTDLLVKLFTLPDDQVHQKIVADQGVTVRQAMASEKRLVVGWVKNLFGGGWAAECDVSFARQPIACMVAVSDGRLAGFACHESTCRNFFGPIGIDPVFRQKGIGRILLMASLKAMADAGYAYAIVGNAGPVAFFEKSVGAIPIPGSTPGIYRPRIKKH